MLIHLVAMTIALAAPPSPTDCAAVFDSAAAVVLRDYAGSPAYLAARGAAGQRRTDSLRAVARRTPAGRCTLVLEAFLADFADPHLVVVQEVAAPPPAGATRLPAAPAAPALRWFDDSTAVLVLPSFSLRLRPAIDSLLRRELDRLERTALLIVDVRGNGGGCNCSYDLLRDLLYTNPVRVPGEEIWATPGNREQYRAWRDDPAQADDFRQVIRQVWPALAAGDHQWVSFAPEQVYRRPRSSRLPRQVGILFDHACASSCEDLLLEAVQSTKVKTFAGAASAGASRYGNVRTVLLPGGARLRIPTSRSGGSTTAGGPGILPQVPIPRDTADQLAAVLGRLRPGPVRTSPPA